MPPPSPATSTGTWEKVSPSAWRSALPVATCAGISPPAITVTSSPSA
ncbi:hypothetical protein [Azospirillum sp. INR13]|nr:hypothetical protein [Azospirillum sp. INR13]